MPPISMPSTRDKNNPWGLGDVDATKLLIEPLHLKEKIGKLMFPVSNFGFTHAFAPTFGKETVYGKMDPIVTFQGVSRSYQLTFTLAPIGGTQPAKDKCMIGIYKEIDTFLKCLYPTYNSSLGSNSNAILKGPPFFRMRYDDLIGTGKPDGPFGGVTGIIENFTATGGISVPADSAIFELKDGGRLHLTNQLTIAFSFIVVHESPPGWYDSEEGPIFAGGENYAYNSHGTMAPETAEPVTLLSNQTDLPLLPEGNEDAAIEAINMANLARLEETARQERMVANALDALEPFDHD